VRLLDPYSNHSLTIDLIQLYTLPLLSGIGLAYTPPIQTLISWFPDKKGMAGGIVVAGFGSGALFFAPTVQYIMKMFAKAPTYIGDSTTVTSIVDGKIFASVNGSLVEAVFAGTAELAKLPAGFLLIIDNSSYLCLSSFSIWKHMVQNLYHPCL
jgi:hypothetical protein